MNGLIFSCLAAFAFIYQFLIMSVIKKGRIREGYCALWIGALIFSIFGAILTLTMYRFSILPLFTLRSLFFGTTFLLLAVLLVLLAPSGISLFGRKSLYNESGNPHSALEGASDPSKGIIRAEYLFNDTLRIIHNLFLLILFLFPIFLAFSAHYPQFLPFLAVYTDNQLCSTFCLIVFLLLLPICLRQSIFWLRNITRIPDDTEVSLLNTQKAQAYYKRKNFRI